MISKEALRVDIKPGCGIKISKYVGYSRLCHRIGCVEPTEYVMILANPTMVYVIDKVKAVCRNHAWPMSKVENKKNCPDKEEPHWHLAKIPRVEMLWNT